MTRVGTLEGDDQPLIQDVLHVLDLTAKVTIKANEQLPVPVPPELWPVDGAMGPAQLKLDGDLLVAPSDR